MDLGSAQGAERLLLERAGRFDLELLLRELDHLREDLVAQGRPAEAELAEFHHALVELSRPTVETAGLLHEERGSGREDPDRPLGYPDSAEEYGPRQQVEREAAVLLERGEVDGALAALQRADEIPVAQPEEEVSSAAIRLRLAGKLRTKGRSREALAVLRTATFDPATGGFLAGDAVTEQLRSHFQQLRGLLCKDNGAYEEAERAYQESMDAARSACDSEQEYQAKGSLAALYITAGRPRDAVREFRRVHAFVVSHGGRTAPVLNNLGLAYHSAGDTQAAHDCYVQALALLQQEGDESMSTVIALLGIGDMSSAGGDESEAAAAYYLALQVAQGPVQGVLEEAMPQLVSRFVRMGTLGERLLSEALKIMQQRGGTARTWTHHILYRRALAKRKLRRGQYAEAVAYLSQLEERTARHGSNLEMRLLTTQDLADALSAWAAAERPQAYQDAFDALWKTRHGLVESLWAAESNGILRDHPAMMEAHRGIYARLIRLLVDHPNALHTPTDQSALELAFDLHEEFKAWGGPAGREPVTPARFSALRDWLRTHSDADVCAFMSYFCGPDALTVFTYVPRTDHLAAIRTPLTQALLSKVADRLRSTFDGDPNAFPPLGPLPAKRPWQRDLGFFDALAPGLLAALHHVTDCELLCVAADGPVHDLPLHALPLPEDGRPLAERHAVVHVGSATTLLGLASLPVRERSDSVYVGAVAARDDPAPERLEHDFELVAGLGWPVYGALGVEATPDTVIAGLRGVPMAHLAAHGWFDVAEPMDSGVLLAYDGLRPPRDPYTINLGARLDHLLTARRMASEELHLDLLTLRACSTARRDVHSTGYLEGIVQALLQSGVRTVVATLWDVDDTSSRTLFADFYRRLLGEAERPAPWRALWDAQRAMFRQPEEPWQSHPFHWAAPALFGLWRHTG
ncbi:CHAT domain-containing protein [Streptomyces sp. NBC_00140]|nr:CHAT domain-containing protein [Streptomyces sp. NBC_00140]MCX5327874.1 CHAT domain-containing protein [Streptomyces sp. NBC_00140]